MFVLNRAEEQLANHAQDIYRRDNDRRTSHDREYAVEKIGVLERSYENSHLGYETAQTGESQRSQTGNYITYRQERHDLHQTAHLADIAGMGTSVNHTDQSEEEGCHQTVRKHLHHRTGHCRRVQHQNRKEYQTAVAYRRICVDVFQVGLYTCAECTVNDTDTGQDQENPCQFVSSLGHQEYGNTETSVTSEFHQHAGMQHRHGGRRRSVTVGRPCVEREHRTQHAKPYKRSDKQSVLPFQINTVCGYFHKIHRLAGMIVNAKDADQQQCRTAHQHQSKLHGSIILVAAAPYADKQIHRNQRDLIEHEHREQVY